MRSIARRVPGALVSATDEVTREAGSSVPFDWGAALDGLREMSSLG
ncbi:MAG: hypothetical protein ACYC90_12430 [Candidatus Nanopelagicales bacterium]